MTNFSGGLVIPATHESDAILLRSLEQAPIAYAATCGPDHNVFFANAAFRKLTDMPRDGVLDRPFKEIFPQSADGTWLPLLEKAAHGIRTANAQVTPLATARNLESWVCTIWPVYDAKGDTECSVLEVHEAPLPDHTLREVAEQLFLSSLRETELARNAETARNRAVFLSDATQRLTQSLDIETTLASIAELALPSQHSWCILDIIAHDGSMRRVGIVHPDDSVRDIAASLATSWQPEPNDFFGLPLALKLRRSHVVTRINEKMLVAAAHGPDNLKLLRQLRFLSLLVVPLMVRGFVIGAVTFIKGQHDGGFTAADIELAEIVSARSALALDNARLYGQAEWLRSEAEKSDGAKSEFLKHMSHELRTPLNAILGYVDLIDMGLRGPVTPLQHEDLERIRQSSNHLVTLVTEILDYTKVSGGGARYHIADVAVPEVVERVLGMLRSLGDQKQISFEWKSCETGAVASADADRVEQILINLVTNAIKYTPPGGHIGISCDVLDDMIRVRVSDDGIGITDENIESIFEPFVQVGPVHTRTQGGVGLGLSISRDLAIAMGGELKVTSTFGEGSSFTLILPRAA